MGKRGTITPTATGCLYTPPPLDASGLRDMVSEASKRVAFVELTASMCATPEGSETHQELFTLNQELYAALGAMLRAVDAANALTAKRRQEIAATA